MGNFFQSNYVTWISPVVLEYVQPHPIDPDPGRRYHALAYFLDGEQTFISGGKKVVAKEGMLLYLPKGLPTSFIRDYSSTCIHFHFDALYAENIGAFVREYPNSSQFRDMFTNLYNIQKSAKPGYEAQILGTVYKIFSAIQSRENSAYLSSQHYKKMSISLDFIENNYIDNRITTPMLAEMSGMSLRYYQTLFNTFFGCSPKKYIMNKKIEEAKKMLLNTALPIHEIALHGGFSDEFHFCKAFKREVGMTPTEFRRFNYIG